MEEVVVDSLSTLFPQVIKIEKIGHDIIPLMPKITVSTPIGSIEADYDNPFIEAYMIVFVLVVAYVIKKVIDKFSG